MIIRPFMPKDYAAVVEIGQRVYPEYPDTVEELRFIDTHRDPRCRFQRYVVEKDGRLVAYGQYDQFPTMYHPQKFDVSIHVDPDHQNQGIGSALYEHLMSELAPFDPRAIRARAREDHKHSVRFLIKRGFVELMRDWESHLDVQNFDFTPYEGHIERVESQGIRLVPISQLTRDPERDRKLYELENEILKDVPFPDQFTPMSFELYLKRHIQSPNLLPDAWYVALDGRSYVGTSSLWRSQARPKEIYTGLTGVRRPYRRRGIALALKLKCLAYAKAHGYRIIKTWNEIHNRPMLSINEQLGFIKQPAWITFIKELEGSVDASSD